jgi:thioredoxin-like negative regulator of GroEL
MYQYRRIEISSLRVSGKFGVRPPSEYTIASTMTQPQKKTRRQMLEEFVAAKPNDAFARYGLAMDCANAGDAADADTHFKALLGAHPEYVAAYFQYGQFLARTGRTREARTTLAAGIATAQRTGDDHARSEMEAALSELS